MILLDNLIKIISVVGPTASGKTALAVEIAKKFNGEVISADSMQIYKGMQIATAKPTELEMQGIKHHLIDFVDVDKSYSVANFVKDAENVVKQIVERGKLPVLAGGTGLYVDSFLKNISFAGDTRNDELTKELYKIYEEKGSEYLLEMLAEFDLETANILKNQVNIKRIIRAIEIYKTTGITISEQNKNSILLESPYKPIKFGLNYDDRQKLYDRINKRVDIMLENGLLKETEKVLNSKLGDTSKMAIGYKELKPYFEGEKSLEECVEKLKMETRRYAKRQITWFKRDKEINWIYVDKFNDFEEIKNYVFSIIKKDL